MPSIHIDPTYHPTAREQLLQGIVASQRDADRIARKRRLERKRWRREHLYPRFLGAAFVVVLFVALLDWEAIL